MAGLLWAALHDYSVFHALIEIFIVVATWGIFVTAWNSRYVASNACILFLGFAYLFVGIIDLLHVLSDKSISVFPNYPDLSSQLQIISRCMQSVSLLFAPFFLGKRLKTGYVLTALSAITACLFLSAFHWHNFPNCFIGKAPTQFLKISQVAVILAFLASIFIFYSKRHEFEVAASRALAVSISLSMFAEVSFSLHTLYLWRTEVFSLFLRLLATYLMYRVVLNIGIFGPFNSIFHDLSLSERNWFSLLEGLPAFVFVQDSEYRIHYANRVFRCLFGDPANQTCFEILKGADKPCKNCPTKEIFRTGLPQQRDWGIIKDKTYAIYEYPYRDANNSVSVLKLGIDITHRKTMETELINARKDLENRVQMRTAELTRSNEALQAEIAERERIQESLEKSREEQRLLSLSLLHAQEIERKRIAMELHDSLGGSLSAIKFRIEHAIRQLERPLAPGTIKSFDDVVGMLQNLIEEVRRIHQNIWPSILGDFGLITAIGWHCRKFEENYSHIHIEKSLSLEESDTPDVLKIVIYRIIQEALNNVAKHSAADYVAILLGKGNGVIELKIRDNGQGFNAAEVQKSTGAGLSGMRERAKLSGGSIEIESGGTGTEIRALWSTEVISDLMPAKS
jgi:signal transduction histidine kinase